MIERTLVIGSTGFLGRHVLRHLHEHDHTVVGMRRWQSSGEAIRQLGATDLVADLSERRTLVQAFGEFTHIVYCAAPDASLPPGEYRAKASTWMRNVLEIARDEDVERVLVTSTAATIASPTDDEDRLADERDVYLPGSAGDHFVEAAYAVEQECFRQAADGQSVLVLNPTTILGPGARLPEREALDVDDDAPVNWVDVDVAAEAHRAALEMKLEPSLKPGRRGHRYIVGGENTTIGDLYARAESRYGVDTIPTTCGSGDGEPYRDRHLLESGQWVDTSRAETDLGI